MEKIEQILEMGKANREEIAEAFEELFRGAARHAMCEAMGAEVTELCGAKYQPKKNGNNRAGSAEGCFVFRDARIDVGRLRVRREGEDGETEEVRLKTYKAANKASALEEAMMQAVVAGASSRHMKEIFPESNKSSRSEVSRVWQKKGAEYLERLRSRDLSEYDFLVLMMDGIQLSKEVTAVVAMGITTDGRKIILDFQIGSTENTEVCKDLLARIRERGFEPKRRLLAVLDGGKALRKSVLANWPKAAIQRCLVHKERNVKAYLSYKHYAELSRLFKKLRKAQGPEAGREALENLTKFVGSKNAAALESLKEAGDDLIALHLLDVPSTLNESLLSSNAIENSFRNVRRKTDRVGRWNPKTGMASKWLAPALLYAERGFHRIKNYKHLKKLVAALERPANPSSGGGVEVESRQNARLDHEVAGV
jgi:transposase-like protein